MWLRPNFGGSKKPRQSSPVVAGLQWPVVINLDAPFESGAAGRYFPWCISCLIEMKTEAATYSNPRVTQAKISDWCGSYRFFKVAAVHCLLHRRKKGRVARINARGVTEASCTLSGPALGIFLDVIHDVVWAIWIVRYTAHSCQAVKT